MGALESVAEGVCAFEGFEKDSSGEVAGEGVGDGGVECGVGV